MANYSSLLAAVNAAITANGTGAITGPVLNTVLQQMIVSLGQGGYIFKGRAIPTTDPGSPDQNVFYIATTPGTYTNFSSIVVAAGECAILKGSGTSWSKEATGIDLVSVSQNTSTGHTDITIGDTTTPVASVEEVSQLGQKALVPDIEILTGGYIGQGGDFNVYTTDPAYYTDFIPLANDLLFFYTGRARYAVCQWAFYDKNKVFISSHGAGTDADNVKVENIPSNAFYIRFSSIYTQMVVWVVSKEKLYALHLENAAAIAANSVNITKNTNDIKFLNNLISVPNYDNNGYYNVGSGSYSAFNDAKAISDYYPIADSIDYVITGYSHYAAALFVIYDEQKNVLGTYPAEGGTGITTTNKSFRELMSIPSNARYIRFSTLFPATADYGLKIYSVTNPNVKLWSGKKWAVVGDSLTEHNSRALKNYHDFIAEETGITVLNYGSSGTGYAKDKNTNSAFFQRINSIPTDVDVITIFGSGNDLGFLPLGEITDSDTTTLCGCINATIDAVLARFPMTPFGIITPTPWFDVWIPGAAPNVMSNYSDALAEICKRNGIPCLNLFYCSNLHPEIPAIRAIEYKRDGTYVASTQGTANAIQVTSDLLGYVQNNGVPDAQVGDWVLGTLNGVHPDEDGHKLFAPRIEAFLKTLLLN